MCEKGREIYISGWICYIIEGICNIYAKVCNTSINNTCSVMMWLVFWEIGYICNDKYYMRGIMRDLPRFECQN